MAKYHITEITIIKTRMSALCIINRQAYMHFSQITQWKLKIPDSSHAFPTLLLFKTEKVSPLEA